MIAFRTAEVEPPPDLIYFLGNVQWVDAFNNQFESAVQRLKEAITSNAKFPAPGTKAHARTALVPLPSVNHNPPLKLRRNLGLRVAKLASAVALTTGIGLATYIGLAHHQAREDYAKAWKLMEHEPATARYEFQEAIDADHKFYKAYCGLAKAYLKLDDLQDAEKTIQVALTLQPSATWAHTVEEDIEKAVAAKTAEQGKHKRKVAHTTAPEKTADEVQMAER
jgi:tetratricopeptide (TPR) repeat protein